MNNIKKSVSIYYNAKDANSQETIAIDEVIELIREDSCLSSTYKCNFLGADNKQ